MITSGPTSEADCGFEFYEHNVENMAIEVIGQDKSSEMISLFLEDWEVGRGALSCHLSMDLSYQEMTGVLSFLVFGVPKKFSGGTVTAAKPSSHRGRAVTTRERIR